MKWTAPTIYPFGLMPPAPLMAWVQEMADARYSGAFDDGISKITLEVAPFCATNRWVPPHTDADAPPGSLVYGWILRNDGHMLMVEGETSPLPIPAGCLYVIDPHVKHWTIGSGELIFMPHITPPDHRTPKKLLFDIRMDAIVANIQQIRGTPR